MSTTTLRSRLTRAFLSTTLIALLLNACLIAGYEFERYRDKAVAELHTQESILAKALIPSLVFNDPAAANQQLNSLSERVDILEAAVFGANGRPFAKYRSAAMGATPLPERNPLPALGSRFSGDSLELAFDIYHDGERVGTLYLHARSRVLARFGGYVLIQALVLCASLGIALLVFESLQRRITTPIARVAQVAADAMARRDWKLRAPAADTRELTALVVAFNGMLGEMQANAVELQREISDRHSAEAELRVADRRKDEFLATLAHEIRNPLAPMMNAMSLLRRENGPPQVREKAFDILDRQLRHVTRLIDDLLDVSRITTGKLSLQMSHVDLNQVLRSALEVIEPGVRTRKLHLASDIPPDPCWVVGDSARLLQVFSNLLSNACRYTPAGGGITVHAMVGEQSIRVQVSDTGVGIEPALQERIFELFEQGDKSLERGNTGLGIGLTLARQLVLLHGGQIAVASEGAGRGSTFTVELPTVSARVPSEALAEAGPGTVSLRGVRVLIADDNVDFAMSLQAAMEPAGLLVSVVEDGRAALEAARRDLPDIAILDIGMPGLNGYDLARALRADSATAGLILFAVSGWGQASDKALAGQAGFDRHFVKPVMPEALLEAMAEALSAATPGAVGSPTRPDS